VRSIDLTGAWDPGRPTLYEGGLPATRQLDLVSARPLRCGAVAMHYRRAR
jgi:hypothetical protein